MDDINICFFENLLEKFVVNILSLCIKITLYTLYLIMLEQIIIGSQILIIDIVMAAIMPSL